MTENRDGTLKVTIREMEDPSGLQATLRADGARVVVTASMAWPAACSEWRGGNYQMGDHVVQTENRTGLPSADGTEFLIRPSDIPAGALLWVGLGQTGKPKGVYGPPGPMSFGYLTANEVCSPAVTQPGPGLPAPRSGAGGAPLHGGRLHCVPFRAPLHVRERHCVPSGAVYDLNGPQ